MELRMMNYKLYDNEDNKNYDNQEERAARLVLATAEDDAWFQ